MSAQVAILIAVGLAGWAMLAVLCRALIVNNPRGDLETGLLYGLARPYVRWFHRLHITGRDNIPRARRGVRVADGAGSAGPLIVVSNHTAGVDPILIQSCCGFEIRWMMGRDMLHPSLTDLWSWAKVIPVSRVWVGGDAGRPEFGRGGPGVKRADTHSAVEAIRHLRAGGVLGVFPEGRISKKDGELLPFLPGVGVIARKTGASILPVVIRGTPRGGTAWSSLLRRSRARIRFLPVVEYGKTTLEAPAIVADLRARMESALKR